MKSVLVSVFFFLFIICPRAQEKPTLTKEETVNYINKRVQEAIGLKSSKELTYGDLSLTVKDCDLTLTRGYKEDGSRYIEVFNPIYINSFFVISKKGAQTGSLQINFSGAVVRYSWNGQKGTNTFVSIPFFNGDPDMGEKLKKAFLHLKDLCKAEDDPFGN